MKQLIYALILSSTFASNANAEPRSGIRSSDFNQKTPYKPEILDLKGIVKSDGVHDSDCDIDLELVDQASGRSYSISEPGELLALHCSKEKDFLVTMKAERTPKFLFWGGNLNVQAFEILEEMETQPHIEAPTLKNTSSIDGGPRR